jgi:hypothetical protein
MDQTIELDGLWTAGLKATDPEGGDEKLTEPGEQDAPVREPRDRWFNAPRFAGLLAVLCLLATLTWFHVRIKAVESARNSAEQAVTNPTVMGTAGAAEPPVRPAPPPAGAFIQTPLTGAPEIRVAAKPIRPERVSLPPERAPTRAGGRGRSRNKEPAAGGRSAGAEGSHQGHAVEMTGGASQTNTSLAQPAPTGTRPPTADPSPTP